MPPERVRGGQKRFPLRSLWSQAPRGSQKIQSIKSFLREVIRTLTLARYENSLELMRWTAFSLKRSINDIDEIFHIWETVPHLYCEADKPQVCFEILAQVDSKPASEHDPLTVELDRRLREDVVRRSFGEPVSAKLQDEVDARGNCSIDENQGEGFHRHTNLEHTRATATRVPWIKASVRHKQVLARAKMLMKKFGQRGRTVIDAEHTRFKRLLQTKTKFKWRPVKMKDRDFYKRVYRMDELAQVDFEPLLPSSFFFWGGAPIAPEQAMQTEYLQVVLRPNVHYSVVTTNPDGDSDGGSECKSANVCLFLVCELRAHFPFLSSRAIANVLQACECRFSICGAPL